jgi:hypothetical protein
VLFGRSNWVIHLLNRGKRSCLFGSCKCPSRVVKRPGDDVGGGGEWEQAVGVGASTSARLTKQVADWLLATSFLSVRPYATLFRCCENARSVIKVFLRTNVPASSPQWNGKYVTLAGQTSFLKSVITLQTYHGAFPSSPPVSSNSRALPPCRPNLEPFSQT